MIIVNKSKDVIVNFDSVNVIAINDDKDRIFTRYQDVNVNLGEYESEEVTQTVFNQLIEALEQCEEIFYMPE